MAEDDKKGSGGGLIILGVVVFQIAVYTEFSPLFGLAVLLFIIGIGLNAVQKQQGFGVTAAQEINPYLPKGRGVNFLETVVGIADNPDTTQYAIGAQPEGTHPTMGGISPTEYQRNSQSFIKSANRDDFSSTSGANTFVGYSNSGDFGNYPNSQNFAADPYDEFGIHSHERVGPITDTNPVATWYNPVDEWQNPTKYW